ncbi:msx2-interacting protein-like [Pollicipes pollicipes]|nr:msx2-interacting protein-like [Pollicipes pollicipes]
MENEDEYCMLLALPAIPEGGSQAEELAQRSTLRTAFITYLQLKQAAGIINIDGPQGSYVVHIFPPCDFANENMARIAPDLLSAVAEVPHLVIVIATC